MADKSKSENHTELLVTMSVTQVSSQRPVVNSTSTDKSVSRATPVNKYGIVYET